MDKIMQSKRTKSKNKVVMLIDDSEIDNYINEMIIKSAGFSESVYVHSGAVGSLEFFKNMESLKNVSAELLPSFLFLDINMPIMDGFQFLDEFNNFSEKIKQQIKIVILTTDRKSVV